MLSKKHGQLKAAVQAIVELSMSWLTEVKARDGVERWLELVETLRGVTEGKVGIKHISFNLRHNISFFRYFWKRHERGLPSSFHIIMKNFQKTQLRRSPRNHYK